MERGANSLTPDEVKNRIDAYDYHEGDDASAKLFQHLYDYGLMMLTEQDKRADRVDTKANIIMAGVIAGSGFLFSRVEKASALEGLGLLGVELALLLSGLFAFLAARAARFEFLSNKAWFPDRDDRRSYLGMVRWHSYAAFLAHSSAEEILKDKAANLIRAQRTIFVAACLLAVMMFISSICRW